MGMEFVFCCFLCICHQHEYSLVCSIIRLDTLSEPPCGDDVRLDAGVTFSPQRCQNQALTWSLVFFVFLCICHQHQYSLDCRIIRLDTLSEPPCGDGVRLDAGVTFSLQRSLGE